MPFPDPLSAPITRQWSDLKVPDEEVLLSATSDVRVDGTFGDRWLVVTDQRVVVLPDQRAERDGLLAVPMSAISSATTSQHVGGGLLEVERDGQVIPVVEFSNSLAPKFAEVARGIQQIAEGKPLAITDELPKVRCDTCGRLLPEKNGLCPRCVNKGAMVVRLASYMRPHWPLATALAVLFVAKTVLNLLPPLITKIIIDSVLLPPAPGAETGARYGDIGFLALLVLAMVVAGLAGSGLQATTGWVSGTLSSRITAALRSQVYRRLERLSLSFHGKREQGALMSVVMNDTMSLNFFMIEGVPYLVTNALMLTGIVVVLLFLNWQLTLFILLPAPLVALGGGAIWRRFRGMYRRLFLSRGILNAHLTESLAGIRVVKAFAQEEAEIGRFEQHNDDLTGRTITAARAWSTSSSGLNFLTGAGVYLLWFAGGVAVVGGDLTLGELTWFLGYLWLVYGPLQWATQIYNWFSQAAAGAERVFEIIDQEPEPYHAPGALALAPIEGAVEFRDVTFGYDPSKPVLKDISVSIEPGEMIGLVGKSGVGKTTFTNLICRFYEPDHGTILIDGHDILKLDLETLRNQIGIVLQDQFLFNGTIADNIRYANPEAGPHEVIAAARAANAHEFIVARPDGYDTRVGEQGGKLSGGEKQRIAIARAILRNPRVLILDEATSNVDTETEHQIQEALRRLTKGRTTFAIAHRLSTLRNADRLIVFEDGQVAEIGTHDELLAQRGIYSKLVQMQQEISRIRAVEG